MADIQNEPFNCYQNLLPLHVNPVVSTAFTWQWCEKGLKISIPFHLSIPGVLSCTCRSSWCHRQLFLGRSFFHLPCGFHRKACLVMLVFGLWRANPSVFSSSVAPFSPVLLFSTGICLRWYLANGLKCLYDGKSLNQEDYFSPKPNANTGHCWTLQCMKLQVISLYNTEFIIIGICLIADPSIAWWLLGCSKHCNTTRPSHFFWVSKVIFSSCRK